MGLLVAAIGYSLQLLCCCACMAERGRLHGHCGAEGEAGSSGLLAAP